MRAATRSTPNDSRATRAEITLELSPLLTAANAVASRIPAASRTVWSKPMPVIFLPLKEERNFRNASGSWSITATECPRSSRMWASVEPTRPHPMITMCTAASSQSAARHGNPPAGRTSRQAGILAPTGQRDPGSSPGPAEPRPPRRSRRAAGQRGAPGGRPAGLGAKAPATESQGPEASGGGPGGRPPGLAEPAGRVMDAGATVEVLDLDVSRVAHG